MAGKALSLRHSVINGGPSSVVDDGKGDLASGAGETSTSSLTQHMSGRDTCAALSSAATGPGARQDEGASQPHYQALTDRTAHWVPHGSPQEERPFAAAFSTQHPECGVPPGVDVELGLQGVGGTSRGFRPLQEPDRLSTSPGVPAAPWAVGARPSARALRMCFARAGPIVALLIAFAFRSAACSGALLTDLPVHAKEWGPGATRLPWSLGDPMPGRTRKDSLRAWEGADNDVTHSHGALQREDPVLERGEDGDRGIRGSARRALSEEAPSAGTNGTLRGLRPMASGHPGGQKAPHKDVVEFLARRAEQRQRGRRPRDRTRGAGRGKSGGEAGDVEEEKRAVESRRDGEGAEEEQLVVEEEEEEEEDPRFGKPLKRMPPPPPANVWRGFDLALLQRSNGSDGPHEKVRFSPPPFFFLFRKSNDGRLFSRSQVDLCTRSFQGSVICGLPGFSAAQKALQLAIRDGSLPWKNTLTSSSFVIFFGVEWVWPSAMILVTRVLVCTLHVLPLPSHLCTPRLGPHFVSVTGRVGRTPYSRASPPYSFHTSFSIDWFDT